MSSKLIQGWLRLGMDHGIKILLEVLSLTLCLFLPHSGKNKINKNLEKIGKKRKKQTKEKEWGRGTVKEEAQHPLSSLVALSPQRLSHNNKDI